MNLRDKVKKVFTERHLRLKAYETGFFRRHSKLSPLVFLDSLFYDSTEKTTPSLNQLAISVKKKYKTIISKQGIAKRYTAGAVKYVQSLIGEALAHQICQTVDAGWLKLFKRVLIKDSTKFDVSENLTQQLPGSGGNASKAGVRIQYEFDIKSGEVTDLTIAPANRQDTTDALATIGSVRAGDLAIRDLGYSVLSCFTAIQKAEAYFLSRLNAKLMVYEMRDNRLVEIDFGELHRSMKDCGIQRLDKQVFIGKNEKFPVRLIVEIMPDEVIRKRLQRISARNKKEGHQTSDGYKDRSNFNLFITNIEGSDMAPEVVATIYKVRWQVELVFKAWKSVFGIDHVNPMKYERLICLLNARLLLILINWSMFAQKRAQLYIRTGKLLSVSKCFKTLQENSQELRGILTNGCKGLGRWMKMLSALFETHHWLERKKNKMGLEEIVLLNTLHSNKYDYIHKKTARRTPHAISLNINNLKFFGMSKITTKNPVLQRNGVKNSCMNSLSGTCNY